MEFLKAIGLAIIQDPQVIGILVTGVVAVIGSLVALIALPPGVGLILTKLLDAAALAVVKHLEQKYKKGREIPASNVVLRDAAIKLVAERVPLPLKVLPGLKKQIGVSVDGAVADMNLQRAAAKVGREIGSILNGG